MAGQTLSEIRGLLAAAGLAPQHRFGQNFLIDLNLMRKLVAAGELNAMDTVLEVGAGTGSLTQLLLDSGARIVAVEIDRGLSGILRERLAEHPRLTLVQGDALSGKNRVNPLVLKLLGERPPGTGGAYKLVANLPYQIATPLLMDLLLVTVGGMERGAGARIPSRTTSGSGAGGLGARKDSRTSTPHATGSGPVFERLTCTIQREVGERLGARPRTEEYGPVSVIAQTLAQIRPIAILPPTAFWPRPQVESLMVTLRPRAALQIEVDDVPGFVALVQEAFTQRRKMLRRLLRDCSELDALRIFAQARVNPEARPEELSPADWRAWYRSAEAAQPR